MSKQLATAMFNMYRKTYAKDQSSDRETEIFDMTTGGLHGNTLAQNILVVVFECALRLVTDGREQELGFQITRRKSQRVKPEVITDFECADDIRDGRDRRVSNTSGNIMCKDWFKDQSWKDQIYIIQPIR